MVAAYCTFDICSLNHIQGNNYQCHPIWVQHILPSECSQDILADDFMELVKTEFKAEMNQSP